MNQFNLGNFLNKFANQAFQNQSQNKNNLQANETPNSNAAFLNSQNDLNPAMAQRAMMATNFAGSQNLAILNSLRMNSIANIQRSIYLKDLMNLPKELKEVLVLIQNSATETTASMVKVQDLKTLLSTNINISTLAEILQKGGKEAMNKLVFALAEASKQGINDTSQLKDAMKLINASVSVAGNENPSQVLKNFMLLYLPWLPLQEGVDFELEIETFEGAGGEEETSLTITISTKNYNVVKILIFLKELNSFDIFVTCVEKFPKDELLKRIKEENKLHSIQSEMTFEQKEIKQQGETTPQAKINMSQVTQVNPFLLLVANALIRHTIDLDNQAS